jgi:transposase
MAMRRYSAAYKAEAVKLIMEQGLTYKKASEDLGISPTNLVKWVRLAKQRKGIALCEEQNLSPEQQKIKELEEANRILKMERDILKKATAFFAKESQ